MDRKQFFNTIKDSFYDELSADLKGFESMIKSALPVFGQLETVITLKKDGKQIVFIDRDEADVVFAPEGVDTSDIPTDMSSVVATLHLDENDIIKAVEHSMHMFTPANKDHVLLLASLIGKKVNFDEA